MKQFQDSTIDFLSVYIHQSWKLAYADKPHNSDLAQPKSIDEIKAMINDCNSDREALYELMEGFGAAFIYDPMFNAMMEALQ